MDLHELLAKEGQLTDEEIAFIEQNLLAMSRALVREVWNISDEIRTEEPELARTLSVVEYA